MQIVRVSSCALFLQVCYHQMRFSVATMLARTELLLTVASDVCCVVYALPFDCLLHLLRKF